VGIPERVAAQSRRSTEAVLSHCTELHALIVIRQASTFPGDFHKGSFGGKFTGNLSCLDYFYARKQLLLSARLSHRNSVCPCVCLSVCHTGGSGKNGAS